MDIKKWHSFGELSGTFDDTDAVLEDCGRILDKYCSHDMLGEVLFEGEDGKTYVVTVEAVIQEANPEYVKNFLEQKRLDEENRNIDLDIDLDNNLPEEDDSVHCSECGAPITDAEHDDNGGKCNKCAGKEDE